MNAMRAFEAAARHVSFVAAAEELNVTPGAISQHIKTLEGWAGTALFRRHPQGVELTTEGQALVAGFTAAFDQLAEAARALHHLRPRAEFHIAALPAVAQLWLPARLRKIRAVMPDVTFSVTAMEHAPRLSREMFDLAIFFSDRDTEHDGITLCDDRIIPVCAPSLLALAKGPDGLRAMPRLHDLSWQDDWRIWSGQTGCDLGDVTGGAHFSLYSLAVEEAKAGAGVLMGHLCLIDAFLTAGTLVQAHGQSCSSGRSLTLQLPSPAQRRPETAEVIELLSA